MSRKKKPSAGPGAARFRATAGLGRSTDDGFGNAPSRQQVAAARGFTLQDEARNTRTSAWGRTEKLRKKPVTFISAGMIEPLKELPRNVEEESRPEEITASVKDMSLGGDDHESPTAVSDAQGDMDLDESPQQEPVADLEPSSTTDSPDDKPAEDDKPTAVEAVAAEIDLGFVIDVTGDKTLSVRVASQAAPKIPEPQSSAEDSDSSAEVILFRGRGNPVRSLPPAKKSKASKAAPKPQPPNHFVTVETAHTTTKVAQTTKAAVKEPSRPIVPPRRSPSASPVQPDITGQGSESKEDGINLDKLLESDEDQALIDDYIANMVSDSDGENDSVFGPLLRTDLGGVDMDMGHNPWAVDASSDDDSAPSGDEDDNDDDGWGLNEKKKDQQDSSDDEMASPTIDDETLAKLLAKQEELGMGSDELILVGGQETSFVNSATKARDRANKEKKIIKNRIKFASASAVADAFDDLDIMDWERPSLVNPPKGGRRGKAPPDFDVSDSDLELHMQTQWVKDRESKKAKKLQREDLRAQGLLGKHAHPNDPRVKYPLGMTMDDIKTELRDFLEGVDPTLQLPPMDKHCRKVLHELAGKFKIKSVSTGSGEQRRPTLTRTKYTVKYVEATFEKLTSRHMERQHFPRLDLKGKGKAPTTRVRRGAGTAAVTYMEGEVVGASAKELGQENKGRNMLEKMGWSMGMGLGSHENKGILQPVAQVVKRSKAGLG